MKKINLIIALSVITMGATIPASVLMSNNQSVVENKEIIDDNVNDGQSIDTSDLYASNDNDKSKVVGDIINANSAGCTAENSGQNTNTWMGITGSEYVKFTITKDYVSASDVGTVSINGVSAKTIASSKLTIPNYIINDGKRYDVLKIEGNCFFGCKSLTGTLTIPFNMKYIRGYTTSSGSYVCGAFSNCSGLTGLDLSNAVNLIIVDQQCFAGCDGIENTVIVFPDFIKTDSPFGSDSFSTYNTYVFTNISTFEKMLPSSFSLYSGVVSSSVIFQIPYGTKKTYTDAHPNWRTEWYLSNSFQLHDGEQKNVRVNVSNVQPTYTMKAAETLLISPILAISSDDGVLERADSSWEIIDDPIPNGVKINNKTGQITINPYYFGDIEFTIKAIFHQTESSVVNSSPITIKISIGKADPTRLTINGVLDNYVIKKGEAINDSLSVRAEENYQDNDVNWSLTSAPSGMQISSTGVLTYTGSQILAKTNFNIVATSKVAPSITTTKNTSITVNYQDPTSVTVNAITPKKTQIALGESSSILVDSCSATVAPNNANQAVTWSIDNSPSWLTIDANTGKITIGSVTDTALIDTSKTITVKATTVDSPKQSGTKTFTLNFVRPTLNTLSIEGLDSSYNMVLGSAALNKQLTAKAMPNYADADVTWSLVDAPSGVTITQTGMLSLNPTTKLDSANFTVKIVSKTAPAVHADKITSLTTTLPAPTNLTINGAQDNYVINKAEVISENLTVSSTTPYADLGVNWSLTSAPSGMQISSTGVLTYTGSQILAKTNFNIVATSKVAPSITTTKNTSITVNYQDPTSVTVNAITPKKTQIALGESSSILVDSCSATVAPNNANQAVTWSIDNIPSWLTIDANTGKITIDSVTDTALIGTSKIITVKATTVDSPKQSGIKTFTLNFVRPALTKIEVTNLKATYNLIKGQAINEQLSTTITPALAATNITWSLTSAPSGMQISTTGLLTYNPTTILTATTFSVTATDTNTGMKSNTVSSTVKVIDAPVTGVTINETTATNFNIDLKSTSNNIISNYTATVNPTNAIQNVNWKLTGTNVPTWLKIDNNGRLYYDQIQDVNIANKSYNCNIVATSVGLNASGATVSSSPLAVTINVKQPSPDNFSITGVATKYTQYLGEANKDINCAINTTPSFADKTATWKIAPKVAGQPIASNISIDATTGKLTIANTSDVSLVGTYGITITATLTKNSATATFDTVIEILQPTATDIIIAADVNGPYDVKLGASASILAKFTATPTDPLQSTLVNWSLEKINGEQNVPSWISINSDGQLSFSKITDDSLANQSFRLNIKAVSKTDSNVWDTQDITINVTRPNVDSIAIDQSSIDANYKLEIQKTKTVDCKAIITPYADPAVAWSIAAKNSNETIPDTISIDPTTGKLTILSNTPITIEIVITVRSIANNTKTASKNTTIEIDYAAVNSISIANLKSNYKVTINSTDKFVINNIEAIVNPNNASLEVIWSLENPVDGVTIDANTGEITIDISKVMSINFTVVATSKADSSKMAKQNVTIEISEKAIVPIGEIIIIVIAAVSLAATIIATSAVMITRKKAIK